MSAIKVAHIVQEDVIPWTLVYSLDYDSGLSDDIDGRPVYRDVCWAAMPDAGGRLPHRSCGESPVPARSERRGPDGGWRRAGSVRPPFGRLSSRVLGIPALDRDAAQGAGRRRSRAGLNFVGDDVPVNLTVGIDDRLGSVSTDQLPTFQGMGPGHAAWVDVVTIRDKVVAKLLSPDLQVVYPSTVGPATRRSRSCSSHSPTAPTVGSRRHNSRARSRTSGNGIRSSTSTPAGPERSRPL